MLFAVMSQTPASGQRARGFTELTLHCVDKDRLCGQVTTEGATALDEPGGRAVYRHGMIDRGNFRAAV